MMSNLFFIYDKDKHTQLYSNYTHPYNISKYICLLLFVYIPQFNDTHEKSEAERAKKKHVCYILCRISK